MSDSTNLEICCFVALDMRARYKLTNNFEPNCIEALCHDTVTYLGAFGEEISWNHQIVVIKL